MTTQGKRAIVVVDLVNDFVTGVLGSRQAEQTAKKAASVIEKVQDKIDVIYTKDSHLKNDPEFKVWGTHCVDGTPGSELYGPLMKLRGYHIKKRHFDSFHDSDLDGLLRALGVEDLYICGISTDICVLHTASGAFFRYYGITIIADLCAAIDEAHHERALEDMKRNYGAKIIDSERLIEEVH